MAGGDVMVMNLRHLLVDVDGGYSFGSAPYEQIRALVGPPGPDRVRISPALDIAGWVNDTGHLDGLPRNIVGSVLLICLGAAPQPYAGPVVITGWDHSATWRGQLEVTGLDHRAVTSLTRAAGDIRRALRIERGELEGGYGPEWAANVRELAAHILNADTPTVRFVDLSALRGGAR